MKRRRFTSLLCTLGLSLGTLGCEKRRETVESMIIQEEEDYVVTVLLDMSGSFTSMMTDGGVAWSFVLEVVDKYFRDRLGTNDKLVIAQISGVDQALLFEGTPHQFRKQYSSPSDFAAFLKSKSSPAGSLVHKAIADSVEYGLDRPNKRSALICVSDMLDNGPTDFRDDALEMLGKFAKRKGIVGLYFVDTSLVSQWKKDLATAGFKEYCVQSGIVAKPTLPSFE